MNKTIRKLLIDREKTMSQLAAEMGISYGRLYQLIQRAKDEDVQRIANALNIQPRELMS